MSPNALSVSDLEQASVQLFAESVKTHSSSKQNVWELTGLFLPTNQLKKWANF